MGFELDPATGLPAYRQVWVTVPRQSGKTTLTLATEVDRCLNWSAWGGRQRVLYAAQDRNSSRRKWEEQGEMLHDTPLRGAFRIRSGSGMERMIWANGSTISITASGETSGHGQTLDLGIIDEAFAQRDERLAGAFLPAMQTRPAAQLWIISTAGTDDSVFLRDRVEQGRARVEAGQRSNIAFFEWSASEEEDPDDEATWWRCMPNLGRTVSIETIRSDRDSLPIDEFSRAYLNLWVPGGRSVIDAGTWAACLDPASKPGPGLAMAVDVTPDRARASVAVASRRSDGRVHVEVVDNRPGVDWVVGYMLELERRWRPWKVLFDPASPAGSLRLDLIAAGVAVEAIDTRTAAQAAGSFYDGVIAGTVRHLGQPALDAAVAGARKRTLADAWAWARKVGTDVSPLVAVTLAHWGVALAGEGKAQIL